MNPVLRVYLFAIAGAVFALIWLINVLVKTTGGKTKISTIDVFLAFTTTVLLVLALIFNHMGDPNPVVPVAQLAVLGVAGVLFVLSLIFMLIESRRAQGLRQSRGVFGLFAALLIVLSSFTVPLVSAQLHYVPGQATLVAANGAVIADTPVGGSAPTDTPIPTNTTIPSPTPTETPTVTRTPRPTDTPTMTLVGFSDAFAVTNLDALGSTEEATTAATAPAVSCMILVNYNLRVRTLPTADADTLTVIPFNTSAPASARSRDLRSWFVTYDGKQGWVDGKYTTAAAGCEDLPIKDVDLTPTP